VGVSHLSWTVKKTWPTIKSRVLLQCLTGFTAVLSPWQRNWRQFLVFLRHGCFPYTVKALISPARHTLQNYGAQQYFCRPSHVVLYLPRRRPGGSARWSAWKGEGNPEGPRQKKSFDFRIIWSTHPPIMELDKPSGIYPAPKSRPPVSSLSALSLSSCAPDSYVSPCSSVSTVLPASPMSILSTESTTTSRGLDFIPEAPVLVRQNAYVGGRARYAAGERRKVARRCRQTEFGDAFVQLTQDDKNEWCHVGDITSEKEEDNKEEGSRASDL